MSFSIKKKTKKDKDKIELEECDSIDKKYDKKCGTNKKMLQIENENRKELEENPDEFPYLYPTLDDPNFNKKIAEKKEFSDAKYDGTIYDVKEYADILSNAEFELQPQQAFVRNFMSFQTPYNSLLLFHGLGSGKTCTAIGVCEEMRDYLKQMGINKQIIIVASPNVQDNFKLQLFDERKLKEVDGLWTIKGCLGNKLLKEINPTGMKGLKKEKIIQQVKNVINASYHFVGYLQFSNEIVRNADLDNQELSKEVKIRNLQNLQNLQNVYNNSLIVIDEVHNIRITDDNENKNVAKNLTYLVNVVDNLRLLLLSATPMFNSYKEIIWLINLMNMNDRRSIIGISDIFDKKGKFKNKAAEELFIQKATGYVSYVRGENPYTFPFRVYPDEFAVQHTLKDTNYPKCQINGKPIKTPINKLNLFITAIGRYQELGYKYIIDRLRARQSSSKLTRTGKIKNMPSFNSLSSFGYTDLMNPIEALNIVYPLLNGELEELTDGIKDIECLLKEENEGEENEGDEDEENDLTPSSNNPEMDVPEEIEEVLTEGPKPEKNLKKQGFVSNSELESEPTITEGLDANPDLFDEVFDQDINIKKMNSNKRQNKKSNIDFDIIEEENPLEIENVEKIEKNPITSFSESIISQEKSKTKSKSSDENIHVIEGKTESKEPTEANPVKKTPISGLSDIKSISNSNLNSGDKALEDYLSSLKPKKSKGGKPSSSSSAPSRKKLYINPKELTGTEGLKRIMDYTDSKTPAIKGGFEYKKGFPHIFEPDQIVNYSAKIKNVCDSIYHFDKDKNKDIIGEGIILIYSAYIDSGILPMALALEEMGFTQYNKKTKTLLKSPPSPVDVRTMKPPTDKKNFKPARYVMITGDPRISPDNDGDVKAITNDDNIFKLDEKGEKIDISGEKIKVVLISQAGSEGLDFKAIRQIHILEPWYNMNRNEQIIGRGVRNFSHKDLPFEKRNVQIFLYGTILKNALEEAADLYVYRMAEIKAVKIGKVTRLLKETAVDCIINHEQTEFTPKNFEEPVKQVLSTGKELNKFKIGDKPNTANCDYMNTCEFKCLIDSKNKLYFEGEIDESMLNKDTYNEAYMLVNSDKIIQKVKALMKEQFFYKKKELFDLISIQKKYPVEQIYAALTQIINDNTEYLLDKYGRTGYLVNIGDYYLFQPSELNFKNISMYNRSVPLDYKHNMINFEIKNTAIKPVIDKRGLNDKLITEFVEIEDFTKGKEILKSMYANFVITFTKTSIDRGNKNWYYLCAIVVRNMIKEGIDKNILFKYVIEHIVDTLMLEERVDLMNFIWNDKKYNTIITEPGFKLFANNVQKYLQTKIIEHKKIKAIVIYDGISSTENLRIFVLTDKEWLPAEPEDKRTLSVEIDERYKLKEKDKLTPYVGFIGFENTKKYMVYKIKDTMNERSTGYRCDQSSKEKVIDVLNEIEGYDKFSNKTTKDSAVELCVRQELTLRHKQKEDRDMIWFLDTETAIYNEFEKRDKR